MDNDNNLPQDKDEFIKEFFAIQQQEVSVKREELALRKEETKLNQEVELKRGDVFLKNQIGKY